LMLHSVNHSPEWSTKYLSKKNTLNQVPNDVHLLRDLINQLIASLQYYDSLWAIGCLQTGLRPSLFPEVLRRFTGSLSIMSALSGLLRLLGSLSNLIVSPSGAPPKWVSKERILRLNCSLV
jgi:hypothetical protein